MKKAEKIYKYPLRLDARLKPIADEVLSESGFESLNDLFTFAVRYYFEKEHPEVELPILPKKWDWQRQQKRAKPQEALLFAGA